MVRKPYVAGRFYPGDQQTLDESVSRFIGKAMGERTIAIIAPHAGYMYSGKTAGAVYARTIVPDLVVLLGPNHTGVGKSASLMAKGVWEMPCGNVPVDEAFASSILASSRLFSADASAHLMEHSLEVQLPFITARNPRASIVPITVMRAGKDECAEMGQSIARAVKGSGKDVLIAISSDMNHYESDKKTRVKDRLAIDKVLALDYSGLLDVASENDISMCGVLPAAIGIAAAIELGAVEAVLVDYTTSGETSGDFDHVVGYAGILIK